VWFGALVPNTAIAKLNVWIPRGDLVAQGLAYLEDALERDPVSLLLTVGGVGAALRFGAAPVRALGLGGVAYLAYVVWIGGDFMSLRFVGAPAVLGAALLVRIAPPLGRRALAVVGVGALAAGLLSPASRWFDDGHYGDTWPLAERLRAKGISDERAFYAPRSRALEVMTHWDVISAKGYPVPPHTRAVEGASVRAAGYLLANSEQIGYFGYFAGPDVYVVDRLSLSDAFSARIPFRPTNGRWRIGHFQRKLPDGYGPIARTGEGSLGDPDVDAACQAVNRVTRGPLWTSERWRAIWDLNTGAYDDAFAKLASGVDAGPWPPPSR